VWDFTGYASYNRVPVPAEGHLASATPWYWESSHFKVALGDLVLARAVGGDPDRREGPEFGGRLTPDSVEAHLARLRDRQRHYLASHPAELAFFTEVIGDGESS
jgi:hypothetical protein